MRLLRGSAILIAVLSAVLMALGQNTQTFPQKQYYASDYGTWSVLGQYPNTYLFSPPGVCLIPSPSVGSFNAFNANAPVYIRDAVAASSEVVTPTSVVATESFCGINATTARSHTSFSLQSATGGLQEVLNQIAPAIPYAAEVILDRNWYSMVNSVPGQTTSAVIASVKGSNAAILEDITQAPQLFYRWNGTQYVAVPNNGSVTSAGLTMPSIFSVAGSPIIASGTFGVTLNNEAANTALRGPASGSPATPGFRTDTAADVAQAGALYNSIASANINGMMYPAQCGSANPPSWCSGSTPDAWVRAACTQLPSNGGFMNYQGLTGNWAASAPCSTPTKQVIMLADNTTRINITEADGGIPIPLDNGSMVLGQGPGQCNFTNGGIHLGSSANVTAIVGPAHTDGTQENLAVEGTCLFGSATATVSQGLIYTSRNFANTTIDGNTVGVCNTACIKVLNNGQTKITNNWLNVSDGINTITGIPLVIQGTGAQGCEVGPVDVSGGQIEHGLGGGPEVLVKGDGTGSPLACDIHIHDLGIERNPAGTPSANGLDIQDCKNCSIENILSSGISSGSAAMVRITQNASGSIANVVLRNISNIFGSYVNTLNDTTPTGIVIPFANQDFITTYYANPGYVQPPVLPPTALDSSASDVMGGAGNFATGSGTLGTGFVQTGCLSGQGLTCTYTRDNSTAPPGLTWSQKIAITASTDVNGGDNGVQWGTTVSFAAGQTYIASFWGKGDGTYAGLPDFLLWNPITPAFYCENKSLTPFTTTWTAYSFECKPTTSGTANIAIVGSTPPNGTGTFWLGGFAFAPGAPLTPNSLLTSLGPYTIGPASSGQQTITLGATAMLLGNTYTAVAGLASVSATTGSFTGLAAGAATVSGIATVGQLVTSGGRKGTFVCTAGGTIPITNANELATSDVVISMNAAAGTVTTPPAMKTVTAGTGFSVLCGTSDTSTYNYDILN